MGEGFVDLAKVKDFGHRFNLVAGRKVEHFCQRRRAAEGTARHRLLPRNQRKGVSLDGVGHHADKVQPTFGTQRGNVGSPVEIRIGGRQNQVERVGGSYSNGARDSPAAVAA